MKRYDLIIQFEDGHTHEVIGETSDGNYYRVSDVETTMIPRPDPEEARKAVEELLDEVFTRGRLHYNRCSAMMSESVSTKIAALLRMMGVE